MEIKEKSYGVVVVLRKEWDKDKFLIIQHLEGHWGFPKGHSNEGENARESALRELGEETGIHHIELVGGQSFSESYNFEKNGEKHSKTVEYFVAFTINDEVKIQDSEIRNYKWVTYDEAVKTFTFEGAKNVLAEVVKYI